MSGNERQTIVVGQLSVSYVRIENCFDRCPELLLCRERPIHEWARKPQARYNNTKNKKPQKLRFDPQPKIEHAYSRSESNDSRKKVTYNDDEAGDSRDTQTKQINPIPNWGFSQRYPIKSNEETCPNFPYLRRAVDSCMNALITTCLCLSVLNSSHRCAQQQSACGHTRTLLPPHTRARSTPDG